MSAAPTKAEREVCWGSRDKYWKCLDDNADDISKCKKQRSEFEGNCSQTWLKYFDRRRDYLKFKDKLEKEGYEPITEKEK